jgi:hypothetical protein
VDAAGNLYVADHVGTDRGRVQKRDVQGNWSVIATHGSDLGQVAHPTALAVDRMSNLYAADYLPQNGNGPSSRIQMRDVQGKWSLLAVRGDDQIYGEVPDALAADVTGNLYVADSFWYLGWIQKRDPHGTWSLLASSFPDAGVALGHIGPPCRIAVDRAGNLYVAENGRIQERDVQGNWSPIASRGPNPGQVDEVTALAVGPAGDLYVADTLYPGDEPLGSGGPFGRIQKRDSRGNWSLIALFGPGLGQVDHPSGLAVDAAGRLYVADTGNNRVLEYDPGVAP